MKLFTEGIYLCPVGPRTTNIVYLGRSVLNGHYESYSANLNLIIGHIKTAVPQRMIQKNVLTKASLK